MGVSAGPNIVRDSDYQIHLCTGSGSFVPNFTGTVEVLVVAGGGGGGMDMGGGGGGGGVLTSTTYAVTAGTPVTVTVGAGGVGAPSGGPPQPWGHQFTASATSGGNSVFGSLTAVGGGYGGSSYFGYTPNNGYGANGGSGGGASGYSDGNTGRNGSGTAGQGNSGGGSIGQYYSGGGGGAGAAGQQNPPHGGAGVLNNILGGGRNLYWGGGGGGSAYSAGVGGNGGLGGGGGGTPGGTSNGLGDTNGLNPARNGGTGPGGNWTNVPGGDGGRNTGGGGGGGHHYNRSNRGGNGGSGVVIIRHLKSAGTSTFNGLADNRSSLIFCMDPANTGEALSVEVLVVGGGGGGGMDMGGGGGGGGVVARQNLQVQINSPMTVIVGAGGNGSPGTYGSNPVTGFTGGNSSIGDIVGYGGGGGGSGHSSTTGYGGNYTGASGNGGGAGGDSAYSGGGRGMGSDPAPLDVPQGYSGGSAKPYAYGAGGGGGANRPGAAGRYNFQQSGGNGGDGVQSSINGTSYYWGGGGGGAAWDRTSGGSGGAGGGGGGSVYNGYTPGSGDTNGINPGGNGIAASSSNGGNGGTNTGGGGGGGTHSASVGGNGGSGIVIVRYYGSQQATGGTITSSGGYTIHTFTSSGTFTPTGTTGIRDISGYNFNLTLIGVTRSVSNGGSLEFNGSTYINLDTNIQAGSTSASYEFWCKPSSLPGSGNYNQLYIQEASTWIALYNTGYVFFGIDLNNGSGWFDNNGGSNTGARTTSSLSANNIYCVTYSWDGSNVRVYLNGRLEATASTLQASNGRQNVTQLGPGTTHRNIGSRYSGAGNQWVGSIYSVKFYNKSLAADEVFQNFTAMRGRFGI